MSSDMSVPNNITSPDEAREARLAEISRSAGEVREPFDEDAPALAVGESPVVGGEGLDGVSEMLAPSVGPPATMMVSEAKEVPFDPIEHARVIRVYVAPASTQAEIMDERATRALGPAVKVDIKLANGIAYQGVPVPEGYAGRAGHSLRTVPFDRPVANPDGEIVEHFAFNSSAVAK